MPKYLVFDPKGKTIEVLDAKPPDCTGQLTDKRLLDEFLCYKTISTINGLRLT